MNVEAVHFFWAPALIILAIAVLAYRFSSATRPTSDELKRGDEDRKRKEGQRDFSQPGKFTPAVPLVALPNDVFFLAPAHASFRPGSGLTFHNYLFDIGNQALANTCFWLIVSVFALWMFLALILGSLDGHQLVIEPSNTMTMIVALLCINVLGVFGFIGLLSNLRLLKRISYRRKNIKRIERFGAPLLGKIIEYRERSVEAPFSLVYANRAKDRVITSSQRNLNPNRVSKVCDLYYEFVNPNGHDMTGAVTYIPRPIKGNSPIFQPLNDIPIVVMYVDENCYLPL